MAYTPQTWADSPATTTPLSAARLAVIENGIQAAAAVADAKQAPISLTTTGTSGAATFVSNTLNIPQYTGGGGGYTPGGTDVAITDGGTGVSSLPVGLLKGAGTGAITAAVAGTDYLTPGATQILTATQVRPRVLTPTASATPTFNIDNADKVIFSVTAAITSLTSGRTGTPYTEQPLWVVFQPTATFAIAWGTGYEDSTTYPLPLTTSGTTRLDVLLTYNLATSKFRCMGVN